MGNPCIGRYQLIRELGHGSEGTVWLAHDPLLDREVAIKTLNPRLNIQPQRLLDEARFVSRVHHHHIVPLFDALDENGTLALVFEYVEGESLAELIKRQGALSCEQAVEFAIQLLDGLTAAHDQGIIHRDIKPSNVLIDVYGAARLTDFGVAIRVSSEQKKGEIVGSHAYIAPEFLRGESAGVNADVFSLGMVLYTMLAGHVPIDGADIFEVWNKLLNEPLKPPSEYNTDVDQRLDDIVLRALFQRQSERFTRAIDMRRVLYDWLTLSEGVAPSAGQTKPTLDFLLRRMRLNSDFPALTQSIASINRFQNNDKQNIHELANTILKDFALTNKLLRLVNSACYSQFRGKVSTISRAAMILGINTIRNLAMSIMLIDHLQNRSQAQHLRENILASFIIGQFAKKLAPHFHHPDLEEAFICGIFHRLGQLLATYYFYEESLIIGRRRYSGENEDQASHAVLGISYAGLGQAIAHTWGLPEPIIASLSAPEGRPKPPKTSTSRLQYITSIAASLFEAVNANTGQIRQKMLTSLADQYGVMFGLDLKTLQNLVEAAIGEMLVEAPYFGLRLQQGELLRFIRNATDSDPKDSSAGSIPEAKEPSNNQPPRHAGRLTAGLNDLSASLMDRSRPTPHELSRMLLETIYSGAEFDRVILFLRDPASPRLVARHAQGLHMESWVGSLILPLTSEFDPISTSLAKRERLYVRDSRMSNLPHWFNSQFGAASFILLPLSHGDKLIGALYADSARFDQLDLGENVLSMLDTLRNLFLIGLYQGK
jgi:eukaryotic-like serine/threonine-protein kinase